MVRHDVPMTSYATLYAIVSLTDATRLVCCCCCCYSMPNRCCIISILVTLFEAVTLTFIFFTVPCNPKQIHLRTSHGPGEKYGLLSTLQIPIIDPTEGEEGTLIGYRCLLLFIDIDN